MLLLYSYEQRNTSPPPCSFVLTLLCSCFDHKGNVEGEERTIRTSSGSHADIQEPNRHRFAMMEKGRPPLYPPLHSFINNKEHCIYEAMVHMRGRERKTPSSGMQTGLGKWSWTGWKEKSKSWAGQECFIEIGQMESGHT